MPGLDRVSAVGEEFVDSRPMSEISPALARSDEEKFGSVEGASGV